MKSLAIFAALFLAACSSTPQGPKAAIPTPEFEIEQTFGPGDYACRPPGMPHGPYVTRSGCTMLEIRYSAR